MKKRFLLLSALLSLNIATVSVNAQDNQAQIDELLSQKEEFNNQAQALYDKFMADLAPLQQQVMDINTKLAELGYVTYGAETNNAVYEINEIYTVENSMFPGELVVVLDMNFTNKQQQPTSPWMAFALDYAPEQVLGQTTQTLMGANGQLGNVENQEAVAMGDANVNANQVVNAIIGVRMVDATQPVQFVLNSTKLTGNPEGFTFTP